jgi:leader peptidase (prepilin peptidase)/N-methyltransferase
MAVALAWAVIGWAWASAAVPGRWLPALLGLACFGVAVAAVDLRHRRIPDALTLPGLPLAMLCVLPLGGAAALRAAAGAAVLVLGHAAVHLLSPRSLGAGDVKLSASLGAVLAAAGWLAVPLAVVLAAMITAGIAVAGLLAGSRTSAVPHGPSMVLAAGVITGWLALAPSGLSPP